MISASGPFDSAWLKWGWAVRHADLLQADIARFADESHGRRIYTTRTKYDPQRHCISLQVAKIQRVPERWSLGLSDTIHAYRSCYDHIAWAIYKRGNTPNLSRRREGKIGFPIAMRRKDFNDSLDTRLPGVTSADRAIVRRYQPYRVGTRKLPLHVLTILQSRSNEDKHRTIQPLLAVPADGFYEVANPRDCIITRAPTTAKRISLEVGAELQRVYVRKTGPDPRADMEAYITPYVAIDERVAIHEWLTQTRSATYQILRDFCDPPLQRLLDIGIEITERGGGGKDSVRVLH